VGWASNATEDQLYYPYVSSCVTVTLIFENGLLGGHASQVTPDNTKQPEQNLLDVIKRMKSAAPDEQTRGALLKIYFIGTADDPGWNLKEAEKVITKEFGQPSVKAPKSYGYTPVDVVFDTKTRKMVSIDRKNQEAKGAAQTIKDAEEDELGVPY
jgi:hypothetical protein